MKQQVFNPYLPLGTCIPDGEPHVFGDRIYIFGSHDKEGGNRFCMENYEVWSAPVDDLSDWTCHGTSYDKANDPDYDPDGKYTDMYAPDVCQGNDGRFYLYYALSGGVFTGPIHVAVSDKPEGPYAYYGFVKNKDGSVFNRNITFDPGVINDNGTIRLYYGWALASPFTTQKSFSRKMMKMTIPMIEPKLFNKTKEQIKAEPLGIEGAFTVELRDDMVTVATEPKKVAPGQFDAIGTSFEGHAFFEASSIRKIEDTYYYIYSSENQHELCYATSKYPDKDFTYRGAFVSNGDIGINGRKPEDRLAMTGNNHGSIECINGKWYIFYHRQTHRTTFSRQGCAEEIKLNPDGSFDMVEMTSCGLNGGPLKAEGTYPAPIACNLSNGKMRHIGQAGNYNGLPYITNDGDEKYITEINNNTLIGYKYFEFIGETKLTIRYKLKGQGHFVVSVGNDTFKTLELEETNEWTESSVEFKNHGKKALYLKFEGTGKAELLDFTLSSQR